MWPEVPDHNLAKSFLSYIKKKSLFDGLWYLHKDAALCKYHSPQDNRIFSMYVTKFIEKFQFETFGQI